MSFGIRCRQVGCKAYAAYRYTWPGKDESAICESHGAYMRQVAGAIGLHLQLIPLTPEEHANLAHPLASTL